MRMESVVSDSDRLCSQWLDLLTSGAMSDVRIQCRDEEIVACHSLVLHVRCPRVLTRAVKEDDCIHILMLDTFSRDTVSTVLEFVYGGVMRDAGNKDVKKLMKEWGLETGDTDNQTYDVMNWTGLRNEVGVCYNFVHLEEGPATEDVKAMASLDEENICMDYYDEQRQLDITVDISSDDVDLINYNTEEDKTALKETLSRMNRDTIDDTNLLHPDTTGNMEDVSLQERFKPELENHSSSETASFDVMRESVHCDICGKPMKGPSALREHYSITHFFEVKIININVSSVNDD